VVVNRGAARTLGFRRPADAIGKTVLAGQKQTPLTIVGVVESLHFLSPHDSVPDTLYLLNTAHFHSALAGVRYAGADPRAVIQAMQQAWRSQAPDNPLDARTIEGNLETYYRNDDQRGRLFVFGAAVAVAIGCVGLYGVAAFSTARRVREIGIRKTLGASTGDVVRLLLWQFTRPVLLANLVAWPLAWLALRAWLAGFDERIDLSPLFFLTASALAFAVALLTVLSHALRAAWAQPAEALRYE
jgi:putative ABC transport system permease protein